jgi:hypothetical protein
MSQEELHNHYNTCKTQKAFQKVWDEFWAEPGREGVDKKAPKLPTKPAKFSE